MVKQCPKNITVGSIVCLTIAILGIPLFPLASCHAEQLTIAERYAVLVEQSPVDAGFVTPEPGIHEHDENNILMLRAIPKPGYTFLHWLGDVDDMTANETFTTTSSPKIIIAVFHRKGNLGRLSASITESTEGRGLTTLRRNNPPIRNSGGFRGGGGGTVPPYTPPPYSPPSYDPPEEEEEEVPEPATLLTLGLGAIILMQCYRKKPCKN